MEKYIPVVVIKELAEVDKILPALKKNGINCAEITFRTACANHGVTIGGHVGADLITLCSMLRIPVTMHNVPDEKVYRPHAWASFGTEDAQAADYAACKKYGPRYK